MNLVCWFVCQGAFGLGGQDWVGPHRLVGRLVLGHTAREGCGWEPTGHYEDSTRGASAGYWVRLPPRSSCRSGQVFERLPRDVAFQAAHDLGCVLPFATAANHVGSGAFIT